MILVILVVHVDARCGVSEGVVQCRDWREFERGNYPMANFLILERAVGEINIEGYPALTRLVIHDPHHNKPLDDGPHRLPHLSERPAQQWGQRHGYNNHPKNRRIGSYYIQHTLDISYSWRDGCSGFHFLGDDRLCD